MSSSATGVGMTICFLGAILLILTQKSSQKFGDVLGILADNTQQTAFTSVNIISMITTTSAYIYAYYMMYRAIND